MINHHAVLYVTENASDTLPEVHEVQKSYEILPYSLPVLSIKDVRTIIERAYQKPFATEFQYIIINTDMIPVDAQNAMLKILEEPPISTRFIIIVRPQTMLLATLRSRLFLVSRKGLVSFDNVLFFEFLESSITERLTLITLYAKDKNDQAFLALYQGLLARLAQSAWTDEKRIVAPLLHFLQLRGASKKMIWEDIALRLPVGHR